MEGRVGTGHGFEQRPVEAVGADDSLHHAEESPIAGAHATRQYQDVLPGEPALDHVRNDIGQVRVVAQSDKVVAA